MFVVTVVMEVHPTHLEAFRRAILRQAANSLALEDRCHQFDVCFDQERPERCFLYGKYEDRSAFDAHLDSAHFEAFDAEVAPWLTRKSVQTWAPSSQDAESEAS